MQLLSPRDVFLQITRHIFIKTTSVRCWHKKPCPYKVSTSARSSTQCHRLTSQQTNERHIKNWCHFICQKSCTTEKKWTWYKCAEKCLGHKSMLAGEHSCSVSKSVARWAKSFDKLVLNCWFYYLFQVDFWDTSGGRTLMLSHAVWAVFFLTDMQLSYWMKDLAN